MAAQNARTAGWTARFLDAVPGAVLGAALVSLVGLLGWIAVSVVNLQTRAGKLEEGQQQINARLTRLETRVEKGFEQTDERLTRLETRMDDLYTRLNDIYKLLAEERLPAKAPPPQR